MTTHTINTSPEHFKSLRDGNPFDVQRIMKRFHAGDIIYYQVYGGRDPNLVLKRQVDRIIPPEQIGETHFQLLMLGVIKEPVRFDRIFVEIAWLCLALMIIFAVFYWLYQHS